MHKLYSLDPAITFLNHGSFGATPICVQKEQQYWQAIAEKNPVLFYARNSASFIKTAKDALANFLYTDQSNLAFTSNVSEAIMTIARSVTLSENDVVLTTDLEYGACLNIWQHFCKNSNAKLKQIAVVFPFDAEQLLAQFRENITSNTKVIFISHITSGTAIRLPVEQITKLAADHGILIVIDGAHAVGQIDVSLTNLNPDFYAGNCHKWLNSAKGCGFLYAKKEFHEKIIPNTVSWGLSTDTSGHEGYVGYTQLEHILQWQGTRDISAWLSLPRAIEFTQELKVKNIPASCHQNLMDIQKELTKRWNTPLLFDSKYWHQMAAVPIPFNAPNPQLALRFEGIEVPVTSHNNRLFLRISLNAYNTAEDIERLVSSKTLYF